MMQEFMVFIVKHIEKDKTRIRSLVQSQINVKIRLNDLKKIYIVMQSFIQKTYSVSSRFERVRFSKM